MTSGPAGSVERPPIETRTRDIEHLSLKLVRVLDDDHQVLRDALWLFEEYVVAMTQGQLGVDLDVVSLPDLSLPVQASSRGVMARR